MTIKELENRTGMARANIRFYENEGLLSPRRLDNGYRDYSEEDVRTLKKIRLLRQLQLDLETIRTVQKGTLTLEQALFAQMTKLEGDKAVIERAAEVCRVLEKSGVEYATLEPEPYLRQLEVPSEPQQAQLPPPPVPQPKRDDTPRACYHPWQRWLARMLDMSLYSAVFDMLWLFLLRDQTVPLATGAVGWVLGLISLVFTLAVEPLWLHYWGWTPGKWVFGLKLRDEDGNKLTLNQGFRRGCALIWEGYALNIPIYGWWRMWQCRKLGLEGRDCAWDGEEDYRYTKEDRRFSGVVFAVVSVLCIGSTLLGVRYTETPPNRGGLTVEQFAENYNYYANQLSGQVYAEYAGLSGSGRWVEREEAHGTVTINVFGDTTVWDDPVFTLDGERVLAVKLHMESGDSLVSGGTREGLALLAMTGAVDGERIRWNLFNFSLKNWLVMGNYAFGTWNNKEFDYQGLHIVQQVEYEGYANLGDCLFQEDGDVPRHCEKTVIISLEEP